MTKHKLTPIQLERLAETFKAIDTLPSDKWVSQRIKEETFLEIQRCPQTRQSVNGIGQPIQLRCVKIEDHDGAHSYLNVLSLTTPFPTTQRNDSNQNGKKESP